MEKLYTLKEIFNSKILRIPDYQRGYAWNTLQIKDFWEDILNLTADRKHYTGMISLKKLSREETKDWTEEQWCLDSYDCYHVVDGQQRLTTFVILLVCILNKIRNLSKNKGKDDSEIVFATRKLSDIKEEYICQVNAEFNEQRIFKFGYEKDNPSFKYLRKYIFGYPLSEEISTSFYTLNLNNARTYFEARIDELGNDEAAVEAKLREIYKKLTQDLLFNLQDLSDEFDVFVAFETMNNRGLALSNLEKLKNRLMYLATLYTTNDLNKEAYKTLRTLINDSWKEVYKQLGRNEKHPLDDDEFLRNHWFLFFKYSRSETSYDKFLLQEYFIQKNVLQKSGNYLKPSDISSYVNDLANTSKYWYYSNNPYEWKESPSVTDEEKKWIDKLNRLEMAYFRPLVVAAYMNQTTTSDERLNLLKAIERFVFVLFRSKSGFTSQYGQSLYLRYAKELRDSEITIGEVTRLINEDVDKYKDNMDSFIDRINKLFDSKDGFYSWEGLKYFLYEYEANLVEHNGDTKISADYFFKKSSKDLYSVEHIFPQTSDKVWYWANNFRFFKQDEKFILCNSLGNLLPLSRSVNAILQNYSYEVKRNGSEISQRRGYVNGSHSEIEVARNYPEWNYETIKKRGLELLEFYENRWNVTIGDETKKLELLHLSFLDEKDYDVPELARFDDDVGFISKISVKNIKKNFWASLSNKVRGSVDDESGETDAIQNGYQLWLKKKYKGNCQFYFVFDKNNISIMLYAPNEDCVNQISDLEGELEQECDTIFDWTEESIKNRRLPLYTKEFDITDYDSWDDTEEELCNELSKFIPVFVSYIEKMDINEQRKRSPKLTEEEFIKTRWCGQEFIDLFYKLKAYLDDKIGEYEIYYKYDYCAYTSDQIFAEVHLLKKCIKIHVRYTDLDYSAGQKVDDSFGWSMNYRYSLVNENQFEEVLSLIQRSKEAVSK